MATLQVRNLPDHIYSALREQAEAEHRSLAQQAVVVLERGLRIEDNRARRRRVLVEIRAMDHTPFENLPDAAKLIREDRDR